MHICTAFPASTSLAIRGGSFTAERRGFEKEEVAKKAKRRKRHKSQRGGMYNRCPITLMNEVYAFVQ